MRKPVRAIIPVALAAAISFAGPGPASAGEGSRGGTFLPMGWDARGQGLAGAATLLARDETAAWWNPANLVFLESPRVGAGATKPFPDLPNTYSTLGAGMGLLGTREKPPGGGPSVRRLALAVNASHLGLELAGGSGWNEGSLGFCAAYSLNSWNYVGAGFRMLKSWTDLEEAGAWGSALDIGLTTRLHRRLWLGAVARNIYSTVSYPERDEEIEPSFTLAASVEEILFGRLSLEADLVYSAGEMNSVLAGAELCLVEDAVWLQGGADSRLVNFSRTIPWFGLSARYGPLGVAVSFGFDTEDYLGRKTRVSLSWAL